MTSDVKRYIRHISTQNAITVNSIFVSNCKLQIIACDHYKVMELQGSKINRSNFVCEMKNTNPVSSISLGWPTLHQENYFFLNLSEVLHYSCKFCYDLQI